MDNIVVLVMPLVSFARARERNTTEQDPFLRKLLLSKFQCSRNIMSMLLIKSMEAGNNWGNVDYRGVAT